MKKFSFYLIILTVISFACTKSSKNTNAETEAQSEETNEVSRSTVNLPRFPSPAALVEQTIGISKVTITYSRPHVVATNSVDRTGKIWGKQVPYDFDFRPSMGGGKPRPWRAGANENTTIEFSHDAKIEGQPIKAGIYGLHMAIHKEGGATVIFSNTSDAWGSFSYDESEDALRVEVETKEIHLTKRLTYSFIEIDKTSAKLVLDWEYKRIPISIEFDTHGMVLTQFRELLADTTELSWTDFNRAATYCADNNINLEEGLKWVELSIHLEENYNNLSTKSTILSHLNRTEESISLKDRALKLPTTTPNDYYSYGTDFIRLGKIDEAFGIYHKLSERWPDHWLTAHGLARAYSANDEYEKALQYEKNALEKAPEANKGFIEWAIEKLEKGEDFN